LTQGVFVLAPRLHKLLCIFCFEISAQLKFLLDRAEAANTATVPDERRAVWV
jgi:hypothetical protein